MYDVYWGIMQNTLPPQPPINPNPPINIPPFPGTALRVGSAGNNVRLVQEAINKLAPTVPGLWTIAADGIFGNGTRDAVMAFQRIFGLTVDGIVGPNTWNRLMQEANITATTPPPTPGTPVFPGTNIGVGASGANVRLIQEAINTIAPCHPGRLWILTVDGSFGNMTRDAIFSFQSVFGMPITGVVNEATWNRLMQEAANVRANGCSGSSGGTTPGIPTFPGNLSVGSSGANVRLVQEAINTLAPSYPGRLWMLTVDGSFGNMTRDAIYTFQSIFGLPITGVVNEATWNRLMQEAARGRGQQLSDMTGNNMPQMPEQVQVVGMPPFMDTYEQAPIPVKDHSVTQVYQQPPYESLPYGTAVTEREPMGMKFSEKGGMNYGYGRSCEVSRDCYDIPRRNCHDTPRKNYGDNRHCCNNDNRYNNRFNNNQSRCCNVRRNCCCDECVRRRRGW